MDREKIEHIINEFNDISDKYTDQEFIVAVYLYIRQGLFNFKYYIDETDIEKISKAIKDKESLFDEDLNYKTDKILNEHEKTMLNRQKIVTVFEEVGDSAGFDEIKKQIEELNNVDNDVKELLECLYSLNYIIIETETKDYASKYNLEVQELYSKMKDDLFTRLGIKFNE